MPHRWIYSSYLKQRNLQSRWRRKIEPCLHTKSEQLNRAVRQTAGSWPKTAERLAFYILKTDAAEAMALAEAIRDVKQNIRQCKVCFNLSETEICTICSDMRRQREILCVVEQPYIIMLEKTGLCKWVYHVLNGHTAPLEA